VISVLTLYFIGQYCGNQIRCLPDLFTIRIVRYVYYTRGTS